MLLTRAQAKEAGAVLRRLSDRFLALRPGIIAGPTLARGNAGIALAHAALDSAFPERRHLEAAERALRRATTALSEAQLSPSLYSGFTGVAWTAEFLAGDPSLPEESDANSGIDAALETHLGAGPGVWNEPYDLVSGLVGVGVFALERLPRPSGKRLVALVVDRLVETAVRMGTGVAWWSDPQWVPRALRQDPHPAYNLGVAHGVPGVIALLGRVAAADLATATKASALRLLEKAVAWTCAQELPAEAGSCFANAVGPGVAPEASRLAWCYGDLGLAAALLVAARATKNRGWEERALRVATRAAARPFQTSGTTDAGLCHGAAGNAHIFHRLFRATGEGRFADAARAWFDRTLSLRTARRGFAGFRADTVDATGARFWSADPGFLTGAAGIALSLLGAVADEPDTGWDRVLLIS